MPITTNRYSISSSMGVGSDSQPVKVKLFGEANSIYLCNFMQFALEYLKVIKRGFATFPTVFVGRIQTVRILTDSHVQECEVICNFEKTRTLAEAYLKFICRDIKDCNCSFYLSLLLSAFICVIYLLLYFIFIFIPFFLFIHLHLKLLVFKSQYLLCN